MINAGRNGSTYQFNTAAYKSIRDRVWEYWYKKHDVRVSIVEQKAFRKK